MWTSLLHVATLLHSVAALTRMQKQFSNMHIDGYNQKQKHMHAAKSDHIIELGRYFNIFKIITRYSQACQEESITSRMS